MEKVFKHRKSGELAYYKDGVFKQNGCSVEIGVEPSSEFWNEVLFITDDGVEMFEGGVYYVPQRKGKKYDDFLSIIAVSDMVYNSETKRFASKQKALDFIEDFNRESVFTTYDGVELFGGEEALLVTDNFLQGVLLNFSPEDFKNTKGKIFAKKENLEEYILINKPVLSLNDLLSVWGNDDNFDAYTYSPMFQNFKNLAKTKL